MSHSLKKATPILDRLHKYDDLKSLSPDELTLLSEELRGEIIRVVTKNGGHLAPSLGAVELICALHYIFDFKKDKIVFDVGHQTYAHKILTGRRQAFETLRQEDGLSGFPKRAESPFDHFDTGHASTSISAALGLACARDILAHDHRVLAVIGDGALTGGMALEALNHAGDLQKDMIVILNDNSMSISPNVGGLASYLSLKLTAPGHIHLREKIKGYLKQLMPYLGGQLVSGVQKVEEAIKSLVISPSTFFEALGLKYVGPLNGHDIPTLIDALQNVRGLKRPVLLHVITIKGKGYAPAEDDPCGFHGIGAQPKIEAPEEGTVSSAPRCPAPLETYTSIFGRFLVDRAPNDSRLCAITAAMSQGTGLSEFFQKFPSRSFDVGIAEEHAVTFAAGLALEGFRPVVAIYSSFLQRSFDQLFHDVALQNLPVIFAIDRAGLVGEDGPTHHGSLDLSYLRLLPNFTVMAPKDEHELIAMFDFALKINGPVAIRYPRGTVTGQPKEGQKEVMAGQGELLNSGTDVAIFALGPLAWEAHKAAMRLKNIGFNASVINLRFIKPLDENLILSEAQKCRRILSLEDNSVTGGLAGAISQCLLKHNLGGQVFMKSLGLPDYPPAQASQKSQRAALKLDAEGIYEVCASWLTEQIS